MIPAFVKELGTSNNKTAGTTLAHTFTGTVAVGNLIVARVLFDNFTTASKPIVSSIGKMAGETNNWVLLGAARSTSTSAGAFASGEMWCIQTTVAWSAAAYTTTLDSSVTMKAVHFQEFSGALAVARSTAGTAYSTSTSPAAASTTGTTPVINDLALGFMFGSNVAAVQVGDNDTTAGAWSAVAGFGSTGSSTATNNFGLGQYKVLTAATQQTYNNQAVMTAGNGVIVVLLQSNPAPDPEVTQAAYQWFLTGTESGSTTAAAQNTAVSVNNDFAFYRMLRIRVQSTTAVDVPATDDWQLQFAINGGGWTDVTTSSTPVATYDTGSITEGQATTNRLTGGTGTFVAGKASEDGLVNDAGMTGNNFTELLYVLSFGSALFANGDSVTFRVLRNGSATGLTYSATPTATIARTALAVTQGAYRFFAEGTLAGAAALAAENTALVANIGPGNVDTHLRIRLQSTNDGSGDSTDDWALQYDKNASGSWTTITTGTTNVVGYNSANLTDGGSVSAGRLTAGTGSFMPGKLSEDGTIDNCFVPGTYYTEFLYTLRLVAADLVRGDALTFRVIKNGLTTGLTYSATPTINILAPYDEKNRSVAITAAISCTDTQTHIAATLTQEGFRWRNDDGSEIAATWKAAQDTNTTLAVGGAARLRTVIDTDAAATITPTLYYKKSTDSTWLPVPVGPGAAVQAVRIDASSEGYTGPSAATLTGNGTIAMWVYMAVDLNTYSPIYSFDNGSSYSQLQTGSDGTTLIWYGSEGQIYNSELVTGVWYYVATVLSTGGDDTLYQAAAGAGSLTPVTGGNNLAFISDWTLKLGRNGFGGWFNGRIAQVKIWSAALSQAELETEMALDGVARSSGLWAYYSFRDGPQTNDESGNGRTLTAAGGTPTAEDGPPISAPNPIYIKTSANITAGGEATTAQLTAPGGGAPTLNHAWSGADPGSITNPNPYELGVFFRTTLATTLYGLRIWNPGQQPIAAGTRHGYLYSCSDSSGTSHTLQRTIDLPAQMPTGWSEWMFSTPIVASAGSWWCGSYNVYGSTNQDYGHSSGFPGGNATILIQQGGYTGGGGFPNVDYVGQDYYFGIDPLYGEAAAATFSPGRMWDDENGTDSVSI